MAGDSSAALTRSKIEYVIFDFDGLLVDSERVYTDVTNEILGRYGKVMTWEIKSGLMGKPPREAAQHLLSFFPDISLTIDQYLSERETAQDLMWPKVKPMPGAIKLVQHLHAHGIPLAVATGSTKSEWHLKTGHLPELTECFGERVVCADDGRVAKGRGKPCPDIFLAAAREVLGRPVGSKEGSEAADEELLARAKGLVFEDAIPGMEAGMRAGMTVVWVPDANLLNVGYSGVHKPHETVKSLEDFAPEKYGLPPFS